MFTFLESTSIRTAYKCIVACQFGYMSGFVVPENFFYNICLGGGQCLKMESCPTYQLRDRVYYALGDANAGNISQKYNSARLSVYRFREWVEQMEQMEWMDEKGLAELELPAA